VSAGKAQGETSGDDAMSSSRGPRRARASRGGRRAQARRRARQRRRQAIVPSHEPGLWKRRVQSSGW